MIDMHFLMYQDSFFLGQTLIAKHQVLSCTHFYHLYTVDVLRCLLETV
jgi:hypothetical protein